MLTAPRYSRVGERCADGETEKLDPKTPKISPLIIETHGDLPHMFILSKEARKHENIPILQKCKGKKLGIK